VAASAANPFRSGAPIDFFGAAGREAVEGILDGAQRWLRLAGTSGDGMVRVRAA
jgi:hypothetical protein